MRRGELLAPAGEVDAAYAAFTYGADAVYAGMRRFSARAEAVNLDTGELGEVLAYAHALTPPRRVFVTVNTLIADAELPDALRVLGTLTLLGVDAVIVQDLGLARLARRHFPELTLHASTQMAIHNLEGALALRELGFRRVTLARELTLDEVRAIVDGVGDALEVEVFVHGALCYAYSGLCLYSALTRGRSGNRGACAYPCRERFRAARDGGGGGGKPLEGFAFSMKDLAQPDLLTAYRDAGVTSFKIEGRKKSPLYVACATSLYRGVLDGTLSPQERAAREQDIQTVFSRPLTELYARSARQRQVTDAATVGHRGARIGSVALAVGAGQGPAWLEFVTERRLERFDGLQVDLPDTDRPYGFGVETLHVPAGGRGRGRPVFEAPVGTRVAVLLPPGNPALPAGAPVYCGSSQAVKQRYRFDRPRAGACRVCWPVDVRVRVEATAVYADGSVRHGPFGRAPLTASVEIGGQFEPSRRPEGGEGAVRKAFDRLGESAFSLGNLVLANPEGRFVPPSLLNGLRRELAAQLQAVLDAQLAARVEEATADARSSAAPAPRIDTQVVTRGPDASPGGLADWTLHVARAQDLDALEGEDWQDVAEVIVSVEGVPADAVAETLEPLAARIGRERIRLALPLITRGWERDGLAARVRAAAAAGWRRWEAANLSAWSFLRAGGVGQGTACDLTTDWSVYVTNVAAARHVMDQGASRFVVAPEPWVSADALLRAFPEQAVMLVFGDLPLFVSETCVRSSLQGGCDGSGGCAGGDLELQSGGGDRLVVVNQGCRSITLRKQPFDFTHRAREWQLAGARHWRVDLAWRPCTPGEVAEAWRSARRRVTSA